ncbi:hypothetical protein ACFOON_15195 [Novosphingobium piscinae]|uniref:Uncharacterized protein n=1 Tax=Novosphingobium piscinae TaxID=1507448 RepID=A0A7X1FXL8_9SPHN|nr:hypothetical protein [Novosphingobium piscinae]MBC2668754.1 hypothetical protein [Novosphingobium piscinae]
MAKPPTKTGNAAAEPAEKPEALSAEVAATEPAADEAAPADPAPEAGAAVTEAEPAEDDAAEDTSILDLNAATLIPMYHPEGGTCDAYASEERVVDGQTVTAVLVPADEAATLLAHGFVVAE